MLEKLKKLGITSPDSFWIYLRDNRENHRHLIVDSEKIKLVDLDKKTLWETSQECTRNQIQLKQKRIILQSPENPSERISLNGKKDNWPLKFALLSAWMNRLTGNDGYLHARRIIKEEIYSHGVVYCMAVIAFFFMISVAIIILSGDYSDCKGVMNYDVMSILMAFMYTIVTVGVWKLNPVAIWLAMPFHVWIGLLFCKMLLHFPDWCSMSYDLICHLQEKGVSFIELVGNGIYYIAGYLFILYVLAVVALSLPIAKWAEYQYLRLLDQVFERKRKVNCAKMVVGRCCCLKIMRVGILTRRVMVWRI